MKSYMILFCVLVYCSKIVDSNPVPEEIVKQRASENDNILANDTPRLYENADIARPQYVNPSFEYRQPIGQHYKQQYNQQWQNNGNYRTYYNPYKAPQPEKYNYRNGPHNKHWVHSNQPVKVVTPVPAAWNSKDFEDLDNKVVSSSASVQNQREWTNYEYPVVKPQYYQGPISRRPTRFFQKPAVQGPGFTRPQYIEPVKNRPIDIVVSNNPFETIVQEPANNNLPTGIESLIESEQVKNEKLRGYSIVHLNGTVEKADEIDEIHKNHPNYVMMNVGDIISNQSPVLGLPTNPAPLPTIPIDLTPIPTTPSPLLSPSPVASSQISDLPLPTSPTKPFRYPQWNNPYYKPYNTPVGAPDGATDIPSPFNQNKIWPGYKPKDVDSYRFPPSYSATPVSVVLPPLNPSTTPMPNIAITPSPVDAISFPKVNEDAEPNIYDDQPTTEPTVVSEVVPVTISPDDSDNDNTTPEVPSSITIVPTKPSDDTSGPIDTAGLSDDTSSPLDGTISPSDDTTSPKNDTTNPIDDTTNSLNDALTTVPTPTTQSSITPDETPDVGPSVIPGLAPDITSGVGGDDKVDATPPVAPVYEITTPIPDPVTAPGTVDSATTPTPIVNIPVTTTPATNVFDVTIPDDDDDNDDDDNNKIITLSPIENPTTSLPIEPDTTIAPTTVLPPITTVYETSPMVDESTTVKSPCPQAVDDVVPEIDYSSLKTTTKPVAWFKTTKSAFLDKLTKGNDYDVIYFMQVSPQPLVQKDTKTTMYPNGTIYEETIETQWDNKEDDEPKITKTIKITQP